MNRRTLAHGITDLPIPKLPSLSTKPDFVGVNELAAKPPQAPITSSPQRPRTMQRNSLDFPEADPWASPALHKGHNHESIPQSNGTPKQRNGSREPTRTTSNFTTEVSNGGSSQPTEDTTIPASGVWGSYDGSSSSAPFASSEDTTIVSGGYDGSGGGGEGPAAPEPVRSFGGGRVTTSGPEETVVITLLPEKEGMFMFQHHNYQVASARRGSKVVRRYSDFVWLLDCLHKRFPFRVLPLLPPKRVGGTYYLHLCSRLSFMLPAWTLPPYSSA